MDSLTQSYGKTFDHDDALIAQHRFDGRPLLPAAAQIEMMLFAFLEGGAFAPVQLHGIEFPRPLALAEGQRERVRLEARSRNGDQTDLTLRTEDGRVLSASRGQTLNASAPEAGPVSCTGSLDPGSLYSAWSSAGLEYGPDLRVVRSLAVSAGQVEADLDGAASAGPWLMHPHLVDGVLQLVSVALQSPASASQVRVTLPVGISRIAVFAPLPPRVTVRVRRVDVSGTHGVADAQVLDGEGGVIALLEGVRMHLGAVGTRPGLGTQLSWTPEAPSFPHPVEGTWVVLRDTRRPERTAQDETVGLLRERGARVVEVLPPGAAPPEEGQARCLSEVSEAAFAELWDEVGEVSGVVHMWSTGPGRAEEEELDTGLHACAHALRTLGAHQRTSRFTVVTEHAQPVSEGDRPLPARSALWGLVRTAAIEYPGLSPRLVDLDSSTASALAAAEEPVGEKPECAYRDGSRTVPCLVEAPLPARRPGVRPGGRYLLLGGHGGIGVEVAARLAGEGAGELVLVGRSDPDPGVVERLAGTGCRVRSLRADASVPGAMAQVVAEVLSDGRGLHGVVHAAGVLRDGLLRSSTREDVDAVLAPKVSGARELASAVEGLELDFAVLFGSVSGTFGNLGQAGYAAANAYLDGFAHAQGSPWTTVSWGLWGEVGMGVEAADQLRRRGVRPLGNQEALDAFVSVLRSDERMVVVAHPDGRTVPHPVSGRGRPLAVPEPAPAPRPAPAQDAAAQDAASPTAAVGERVERFLARRLGAERLTPATPLSDYGIDSIMSVEMAEELSRIVGRELPSTLFLEHPDVAGVTRALIEEYGVTAADGTAVPAAEADTPPAPAEEPVEEGEADSTHGAADAPVRDGDVAIVAVSGDLPGAEDLDGFWDLLMSGGTAFTEVPEQRWDVDALFEPRSAGMSGTYCRNGAFLRLPDRFDHRFFQTSRREADEMDPQQKLLLEHAWRVVDEAGLSGRPDIGVFVGATYQHHRDASGLEEVSPHTALGSMNALLANRISYTLDLTGPSQTVDTLCSSSLVALHQAVQALRAGQCGAAVVAACHVGLTPWYYRSLSQLGALSPDLPRPFDEDADGFVPGEGAVAVLLRPLADAERDGDHVWGVVRGTAVNHGGRGGALPVPRRSAQEAVIRAALADAGTAPEEVSLIEAHGTATQLGDPVEVAALGSVFGSCAGERLLGSLKANIGHLEPASGLAALVKVLLCLRHGAVPPLAGYRTPSSRIDLEGAGLSVNREARAWSDDRPRVAGVSAFGMGGANAHAVIAEHQRETAPEPEPGAEQVLLLSGHTPEALTRRIRDVADWLSTCEANLAQVCFSAAVGRDHREFRAAFYGTDRAEILAGAHRSLESETGPVGVWAAGVGTPLTGPAAERAARFVGGETVDRGPDRPSGRRVVLPPYPLGGTPAPSSAPGSGSPVTLPKTEEEGALVAQHRVRGEQTVPAALLVLRALAHADAVDEMVFAEPGTGPGELTEERSGGTLRLRWDGRNIARARLGGTATQAERTVPDGEPRRSLDPVGLYAWFEAAGVEYGPALAVVDEVRFDTGVTVCSLRTDPNASPGAAAVAALDAALQSMAVLTIADRADTGPLCLPASVDAIRAFGDPALCRRVRTRLVSAEPGGTRVADTVLLDEGGRVLLSLSGVHYAPVPAPDRRPLPEGEPEPGPPAPSRNRSVTDVVRTLLREPDLTPDTPFTLLAVDSMLATEISERLESELAVTVSALDVLDARDCRALAAAVGAPEPEEWQTRPQEATAEEPPAEPADRPAPSGPVPHPGPGGTPEGSAPGTRDVAVVGVALALPGARTPEELWGLLEEGRSAVGTAPAKRWEGRRTRPPGGFLEDIEDFDAQLFGVFANQARVLDPQARWLLRGAWECLESAGVPPTSAAGTRTGMFVGASYQHYREYNIEPELDALSGLGNHNAFLANRVSHFLDLRGPSMTIDTLCSSSLVALHQAVRSIRDGECEQALVAGVRLALSPLHYHAMNSLKALSPTGRSRAFDATADGFVPGEGVITLLLKPLHHALRDHDHIHTIIKGTAVNHGGRTSGLTVPNSTAQQQVITAALRDADTDPDTITLLEAHGTGTPLGDPIEIEGLTHAYRQHTPRHQYCAIGSIKTNIGHLEPAAGLAGLAKIILAMRHHTIPPTLHLHHPNPNINFETTPFYTTTQPTPWTTNPHTPRRAGLSAFGMGGVNAHIILEEPPNEAAQDSKPLGEYPIRVSGATEEAVRELAQSYAERIESCRSPVELANVCHTINTGRAELGFQTAVLGEDAASLARALREAAETGGAIVPAVGPAGGPSATDPDAAVRLARRGHTGIDWAAVSAPGARVVPDVPSYPFARRSFWSTRDHAVEVPAPREAVPATVTTETPRALRTRWRPSPAPTAPHGAGGRVRLVCEESDPLGRALHEELLSAGYTVSTRASDTAAPVLVVVDRGSEGFWSDLGEWTLALAPGQRLSWIGRGTAAVTPGEPAKLDPGAAARAAAVLAAAAESRLTATATDLLPDADPAASARAIVADLAREQEGPEAVAVREGVQYRPHREALTEPAQLPDLSQGFVLVTGGSGGVGRLLVGRLAELGARRVGIIGRRRLDTADLAELSDLAPSADVAYLPCDVTEESALRAAVHEFSQRWGRLTGIVHASGRALAFGSHRRRGAEEAARTLSPKTAGSDHVLAVAREREAAFVVLVSSVAGEDPAAGRGLVDYAMANAYQLGLAERAGSEAGPTVVTAHAWPDWSGVGLEADASFSATASLKVPEALAGFSAHLCSGGRVSFPGRASAEKPPEHSAQAPPETRSAAHATVGVSEGTVSLVRSCLSELLGEDPGDRPVSDMGLDSLAIADLVALLERRHGRTVDPSAVMRARTVEDVAALLDGGAAPEGTAPVERDASAGSASLSALLRPLARR